MSAHDSAILDSHTRSLEAFDTRLDPGSGIDFHSLDTGAVVSVHTKYSCYRLQALDPESGCASVVGGSVFAEPTAVRVEGATDGGTALKAGWIGVGMRLEMSDGSKRITTSVVQSLTLDPPRPQRVF